jgi:hypothetical protein
MWPAIVVAAVLMPVAVPLAQAEPSRSAARPTAAPGPPARWQKLAAEFSAGTHMRATDHYLIIYDTHHAWADNRIRLLETAYANFRQSLTRGGFKLAEPTERLVCIVFDQYEDYVDYAARKDNRRIDWASGYYAARSNRIVLFNYLNSPQLQGLSQRITELRAQSELLEGQIASAKFRDNTARARSLSGKLNRVRGQLSRTQRQYHASGALSNLAITFHEAAHLLAFNLGVQSRQATNPFWFTEGLATSFETIAPAAGFGPGFHNEHRYKTFKPALDRNRLIDLDEFVAMHGPFNYQDKQRELAYAQAWGLFHYLFVERNDDLVWYAGSLRRTAGQRLDDEQLRKLFTDTFGPSDLVLESMKRYFAEYQPKQ